MTITEIAREANVAIATVDRVLHDRGRVSEATKQKILKIVEESGYKPNQYARNLRLQKEYRFGVLIPKNQFGENEYWDSVEEGCHKAAAELKNLPAKLIFSYYNVSKKGSLLACGEELLSKNIDGLIMAPINQDEALTLIGKLGNIPYCFVDSSLSGVNEIIDVSQDSFQAGKAAGKMMNKITKKKLKNVAVLIRQPIADNAQKRIAGLKTMFDKDVNVIVLSINRDKEFLKQIGDFLATKIVLDGLFILNSGSTEYLKEFPSDRIASDAVIIGYDAIRTNCQLLEMEIMDCVISQEPHRQGYNATYQMYISTILGNKDKKDFHAPITLLIKENLSPYLKSIK